MAIINSTIDNSILYNIMSNAAKLPGYVSKVDKITEFVYNLPQDVVDQYHTKSKEIIDSKKYTAEQFANMYEQQIVPLIDNSTDENDFSSRLLNFLNTL